MGRIANDVAELPPHMQAVFFRQFAREADSLAHKSASPEGQESYRGLAEQWRALAELLDSENELHDFGGSPIRPAEVYLSH